MGACHTCKHRDQDIRYERLGSCKKYPNQTGYGRNRTGNCRDYTKKFWLWLLELLGKETQP